MLGDCDTDKRRTVFPSVSCKTSESAVTSTILFGVPLLLFQTRFLNEPHPPAALTWLVGTQRDAVASYRISRPSPGRITMSTGDAKRFAAVDPVLCAGMVILPPAAELAL